MMHLLFIPNNTGITNFDSKKTEQTIMKFGNFNKKWFILT